MRRRLPPILALLGSIVACQGADPPPFTTRDSGGIAIVEYARAPDAPTWLLSPEPILVLGGLDTGGDYELYEALHALQRADGGVVVANQGTEEMRFYGPDGSHVRTVGGEGGGPGEFEAMGALIALPGDSLAVWDRAAKRLTIYDGAGTLGRVVTVEAGGFSPRLIGRLDDRRVAIEAGLDAMAVFTTSTGAREDSLALLEVDVRSGAILDTLGPYPGDQQYVHVAESGFWMRRLVFGREGQVVVAAGRIHVGDDRRGEIRIYDPKGRLTRIVRTGGEGRPATADAERLQRDRALEDVRDERLPEERRRLAETPTADRFPAFDELFADRLGRIWIREFDPELGETRRWVVFDETGRAIGRLELPERFQPLDAREDRVLFRTRDALDVEHLLIFPLRT